MRQMHLPLRLMGAVTGLVVMCVGSPSVTQPGFECSARFLAYDHAKNLLPSNLAPGLEAVRDALQLQDCETEAVAHLHRLVQDSTPAATEMSSQETLYVDASNGNDQRGDGSLQRPFKSIVKARDEARIRNIGARMAVSRILLASGRYALDSELELNGQDDGILIEGHGAVISGGVQLKLDLSPVPESSGFPPGTMYTQLAPSIGPFLNLYEDLDPLDPRAGARLPWAREPNGDMESDLQPANMAKAKGEGRTPHGPGEDGAIYSVVETPKRNNSVYPVFGRDYDPRDTRAGEVIGWQWRHVGGSARRFGDDSSFWNGTVATSMKFGDANTSIGKECVVTAGGQCRAFSPFRGATAWTNEGVRGGIAHVFHDAYWGNWQWELMGVNTSTQEIEFGRGGFQEGHGGSIGEQPFFVEGVREALDAKGEWWVDPRNNTLYIIPNNTAFVVAPRLKRLISIRGEPNQPCRNITLRGLTFAHTAPTYPETVSV